MQKRKLTFPPAVGTFESNQKRRVVLIAKQRAAQQSIYPTKATPRQTESLVNKIVGLFSRLCG